MAAVNHGEAARNPRLSPDILASDSANRIGKQTQTSTKKNKIMVLQSAPLVREVHGELHPISTLDMERERNLLFDSFRTASRDIELKFDTATVERLEAITTENIDCSCLHFSGHGNPHYLVSAFFFTWQFCLYACL